MFANWSTSDYLALAAIIISVLMGVLVPFFKYLYNKFFKSAKVTIIPFGKTTFYYNGSGSYIKMKFSLDCKNQDIVVNNVKIKVTAHRKTGKTEILNLGWENFEPVAYSWIGSNMANSINSTAYARPIKISKNSIEPFIIEFANNNQDAANELSSLSGERESKIRQQHNLYVKENEGKILWFGADDAWKVIDAFKSTEDFSKLKASYEKYFFWEEGSYLLELSIEYDDKQKLTKMYEVRLDNNDETRLRENTEAIMLYVYKKEQNLPIAINILNKDIVERGDS